MSLCLPIAALLLGWSGAAQSSAGGQGDAAIERSWRRIAPPLELEWPRDHGAHLDVRTEWWYLTGLLATEAGRELGFQVTIFRSGLEPGRPGEGRSELRPNHVLAGHFAIADVERGELLHAERMRRVGAGLAEVSETDLDARIDGWSIRRDEQNRLLVIAADAPAGIELELVLVPRKPLVLHGAGGYSRKGAEGGNASVYSSWTRLAAVGTVTVNGEQHRVGGDAWYDHEWGTSQLGQGVVGWDWFSLQLEDGRELMLYLLRREDGAASEQSGGTLIEADGTWRALAREELRVEVTTTWRSPHSGALYPGAWRVGVPSANLALEVVPLLADAELDTSRTAGVVYWEGPVRVRGSAAGQGYVELTGYAGDLKGRF